jgi:ABC-type sugar transport system permease subunit
VTISPLGMARKGRARYAPYNRFAILLFVLPFLILYLVYKVWPLVFAFALSFHNWRGLGPWDFVGLENYRIFFRDPRIGQAIANTLTMGIGELLVTIPLGLMLALLLDSPKLWGKTFFRVVYFMPRVISLAVAAIAFSALLQREYGVVNYFLGQIGIGPIPWLEQGGWARLSIIMTRSWGMLGFVMIYFTAGLAGIPKDLYEAASIDGATWFQSLMAITIPMLRRVVVFVVIIGTVQAFQLFAIPYLMTGGGPSHSTTSIIMIMITRGISASNYGVASAITVVLTSFLAAVAALQFRFGGSNE